MARKIKRLSLGTRIRRLREDREMQLPTLANETGYKVDYLEDIESDKVIPPVAVLLSLGRALEVDSDELLKDDGGAAEKREEAVRIRTEQYSYRLLTSESRHKHLKGFLITIEAQSDLKSTGFRHEGEEFHYVLKGEVQVTVGENVNLLGAGDSLHFNSAIEHKLSNVGAEQCELLVVLYTP